MVANYPYFGLPNYMNYMNPNVLKNIQPPKQEFSNPQPHFQAQSNFQNKSSIYTNPYYFNKNRSCSRISADTYKNSLAGNTYNYKQVNTNKHSSNFKTTTNNSQISSNSNRYKSNFQPSASMHSKKEKAKQQEPPPLFSFLGINLYFDDVLILCILFFLYNEQVNDPYLFFTLILLLLT